MHVAFPPAPWECQGGTNEHPVALTLPTAKGVACVGIVLLPWLLLLFVLPEYQGSEAVTTYG